MVFVQNRAAHSPWAPLKFGRHWGNLVSWQSSYYTLGISGPTTLTNCRESDSKASSARATIADCRAGNAVLSAFILCADWLCGFLDMFAR